MSYNIAEKVNGYYVSDRNVAQAMFSILSLYEKTGVNVPERFMDDFHSSVFMCVIVMDITRPAFFQLLEDFEESTKEDMTLRSPNIDEKVFETFNHKMSNYYKQNAHSVEVVHPTKKFAVGDRAKVIKIDGTSQYMLHDLQKGLREVVSEGVFNPDKPILKNGVSYRIMNKATGRYEREFDNLEDLMLFLINAVLENSQDVNEAVANIMNKTVRDLGHMANYTIERVPS